MELLLIGLLVILAAYTLAAAWIAIASLGSILALALLLLVSLIQELVLTIGKGVVR